MSDTRTTEGRRGAKNPPFNPDAEKGLLCCFLRNGDLACSEIEKIGKDWFFDPRNRDAFSAMRGLYDETTGISIATLLDRCDRLGKPELKEYLQELSDFSLSSAGYREYFDILDRDRILRRLISGCDAILGKAHSSSDAKATLVEAEKLIFDISSEKSGSDLTKISETVNKLAERFDKVQTDKDAFKGLMTGFPLFDKLTNGLRAGELIILAGRPSLGKTAFALNIADNVIRNETAGAEKCIAVFSLEMSSEQILMRMLANLAGVKMGDISRGEITDADISGRIMQTFSKLYEKRVFINDSSLVSPSNILNQCRRLKLSEESGRRLDLVIVDYLGLMINPEGRRSDNRQQEVANISRLMKAAAKELACPVILLCQLSRQIEHRENKIPQLSDLRESGQIEQDADIVMFLSREDESDNAGPIILSVQKHRNGELGQIRLEWDGSQMRFEESSDQSKFPAKTASREFGDRY